MLEKLKEHVLAVEAEIQESRDLLKSGVAATTQTHVKADIEVKHRLLKLLLKILAEFAADFVAAFIAKKQENPVDKDFSIE